ncbi:MAG: cytochrome P450 [Cytophagales bacterium CG18_big_fil_WC_8_21_14_2_50_42_9]|nr:MAG: cytochrome P450 [Cytophagales bacterium CG18_big_fil_WC_8_21_14_2_50_42_9]
MLKIPRDKKLDSTLDVFRDGYTFIQKKSEQLQSDIFQTRLLGMKVICLHGPEGAQVFYDPEKFMRKGAMPKRVQKTLTGENGVQTLDNEMHHQRKAMFMSLMNPGNIHRLMVLLSKEWQQAGKDWENAEEIVLFKGAQDIMCRAACAWVGVPLPENKVRKRARDLGWMVDALGAVGPKHWRGKQARRRSEKWIEKIIKQIRNGKLLLDDKLPAAVIARHRDANDQYLDRNMAAIELLNLIRPIVAIAWYVVFSALALHQYPVTRQKFLSGAENYDELFVQEVRRFYPFTPFLGALVRQDFNLNGYYFPKGTMVLQDVYGMHHDARVWERPDAFYPERFRDWQGNRFDFMPQGGGDFSNGHRCAGEWITIEAMKLSLHYLTKGIKYEVPEQDLHFSLSKLPTLPESGFIINRVRRVDSFESTITGMGCPFHK